MVGCEVVDGISTNIWNLKLIVSLLIGIYSKCHKINPLNEKLFIGPIPHTKNKLML